MKVQSVTCDTVIKAGGEYLISTDRGGRTLALRIVGEPSIGTADNGIEYAVVRAYRIRRDSERASFGEIKVYVRRTTDFVPF